MFLVKKRTRPPLEELQLYMEQTLDMKLDHMYLHFSIHITDPLSHI